MNDRERELWVMNDYGLYTSWKRSKLSKRKFIRDERKSIDNYIDSVMNKEPLTIRKYWE